MVVICAAICTCSTRTWRNMPSCCTSQMMNWPNSYEITIIGIWAVGVLPMHQLDEKSSILRLHLTCTGSNQWKIT